MATREQARMRARKAFVSDAPPAEEAAPTKEAAPAEETNTGGDTWDQAVAELEAADAEEFLSPAYMEHSQKAADLFEQAARDLQETDPERSAQAADIAARLMKFLMVDWGDPADVETSDSEVEGAANDALLASGAPVAPPLEWFRNPKFSSPTPLTVDEDGHVYGHIALWNTCHTGHEHRGQCIRPPRSHANYAHFLTGSLITDDGTEVSVGHITLDTRHANERLNAQRAAAHYDHTGHVVADVNVGEDAHGIWFSGALRSTVNEATLRALRSAPLSGDWRRVGGNLELVAALGVNMPGFPVPRPTGLVASGRMHSLVASGMVPPKRVIAPGKPGSMSESDLLYLQRLAQRERMVEASQYAKAVKDIKVRRFAAARKGK